MSQLFKYLICIAFGVVIGFVPYYIGTKPLLNRPTVVNEFKKIKNKRGNTAVEVETEIQEAAPKTRRRLFNRNK